MFRGERKMPETTENYHHIPVANKKEGNELRTISLGKGIKALYDPKRKIIVTYLFSVKKYSMKEAKQWIKKHKSSADISVEAASLVKDIQALYREAKQETLQNLN
jgi:hypothetical protein